MVALSEETVRSWFIQAVRKSLKYQTTKEKWAKKAEELASILKNEFSVDDPYIKYHDLIMIELR